MDLPIYVISYDNEERKNRMINRFNILGCKNVTYLPGVSMEDDRITSLKDRPNYNKIHFRVWATMLAHMDAVKKFYFETTENICIICEDDIHISRKFNNVIPSIITDFNSFNLDVLLLGYLLPFKLKCDPIKYLYYKYSRDVWGAQMYMISRKYAKYLIDKYTIEYAYENIGIKPYSSDWIITKDGNKLMIYPMIAVEEGTITTLSDDQSKFHKKCHDVHYDQNLYI